MKISKNIEEDVENDDKIFNIMGWIEIDRWSNRDCNDLTKCNSTDNWDNSSMQYWMSRTSTVVPYDTHWFDQNCTTHYHRKEGRKKEKKSSGTFIFYERNRFPKEILNEIVHIEKARNTKMHIMVNVCSLPLVSFSL